MPVLNGNADSFFCKMDDSLHLGIPHTDLFITDGVCICMTQIIRASPDKEQCGFLLGNQASESLIISQVIPANNSYPGNDGFAINTAERRRAFFVAGSKKQLVIAVYHTHPSHLMLLSEEDNFALKISDLPWVILSINTQTQELLFKAYQQTTCLELSIAKIPSPLYN